MVVKAAKLDNIKNKIRELEQENDEIYDEIDRNQDLYGEGYINSLACNRRLESKRHSNLRKISRLQNKEDKLYEKMEKESPDSMER